MEALINLHFHFVLTGRCLGGGRRGYIDLLKWDAQRKYPCSRVHPIFRPAPPAATACGQQTFVQLAHPYVQVPIRKYPNGTQDKIVGKVRASEFPRGAEVSNAMLLLRVWRSLLVLFFFVC